MTEKSTPTLRSAPDRSFGRIFVPRRFHTSGGEASEVLSDCDRTYFEAVAPALMLAGLTPAALMTALMLGLHNGVPGQFCMQTCSNTASSSLVRTPLNFERSAKSAQSTMQSFTLKPLNLNKNATKGCTGCKAAWRSQSRIGRLWREFLVFRPTSRVSSADDLPPAAGFTFQVLAARTRPIPENRQKWPVASRTSVVRARRLSLAVSRLHLSPGGAP